MGKITKEKGPYVSLRVGSYIPYSYIFKGPNRGPLPYSPIVMVVTVVTVVMLLGLPWDAADACPLFSTYSPCCPNAPLSSSFPPCIRNDADVPGPWDADDACPLFRIIGILGSKIAASLGSIWSVSRSTDASKIQNSGAV